MTPQPFRLLGDAQRTFLQEHAASVVAGWAQQWLRDGTPTVEVRPIDDRAGNDSAATAPRGPWLKLAQGDAACHLLREAGVAERLIFGTIAVQQPSELARDAADTALQDLARRCLGGVGVPLQTAEPSAPATGRRGAGALRLRLAQAAGTIELLLDAQAVGRWLAQRPRLSRAPLPRLHELRAAVGQGRLRLDASAGQAEIDIATLQSLAVGDVVTLDLPVDQPLRLSIDGRPATRRAYLGFQGGKRALRLTAGLDFPESNIREGTHE